MQERTGPNVKAVFTDASAAHDAVVALERAGIEGGEIGVAADGPDRPVAGAIASDGQIGRDVASRAVVGGAAGALVGAAIAAAVTAVADGVSIGAVIGAALFASAVGALIAVFTRLGGSEAWSDTMHLPESRPVEVRVTSTDPATLDRAGDVLTGAHDVSAVTRDDAGISG